MRGFIRSSPARVSPYKFELRVVQLIATRRGDPERGPQIRLNPADAKFRLLVDDELVWIHGPRGQQVAPLVIDASVEPYTCILRDLGGIDVSESVQVTKPDLDALPRTYG